MASLLTSAGFSCLCADSTPTSCKPVQSSLFQSSQSCGRCMVAYNSTLCGGSSSRGRCFISSAYKKKHVDGLPPGAYEMIDQETGDRVIVFGVEGREDSPPPDDELRWDPARGAKSGDISERAWQRLMEHEGEAASSLKGYKSSGSVKRKTNEPSPQKKPHETSTLKSKGLFSRLKVQTVRNTKSMGSDRGSSQEAQRTRSLSTNVEDSEPSDPLIEDTEKNQEILSRHEEGHSVARMQELTETPSSRVKVDRGRNNRQEVVMRLSSIKDNLTSNLEGSTTSHLEQNRDDKKSIEDNLTSNVEGSTTSSLKDNLTSNLEGSLTSCLEQNRDDRRGTAAKPRRSFKEVVAEDFFSMKSFKDVGASDRILQSLQFMEMRRPSQIQAIAYSHILKSHSCIIADQTGSGKTLAYLAPLFQCFLREEEEGFSKSLPKRPRGLITVPTSELAAQVLGVCRSLSKGGAQLKSMVATGGFRLKTQVDALENGADIVIATPGRCLQLLKAGDLGLDNLRSVVLDEVDILFDDPEFSETLVRIESLAPVKTQYIHVTATLPVDICDRILEKHPASVPLMGPGLHCTAAGLQEVLVDCSGEGEKTPETAYENKKKALLQLVEQQPVPKTIIFCNKIETCRKVENALKRFDKKGSSLSVLAYHAALSSEARLENMRQFTEADAAKSVFLVCTDRASRGLDLVDVEHVVLFDFPRDPSEYVRRVGRTARAGGSGKAFVLVVGKQVSLARKIMIRNEKGHPIHTVPSHSY